jgi:hypothetical protein
MKDEASVEPPLHAVKSAAEAKSNTDRDIRLD